MVKSPTQNIAAPEWQSKLEVIEERHSHLSKKGEYVTSSIIVLNAIHNLIVSSWLK